jgi:hypothetical protein
MTSLDRPESRTLAAAVVALIGWAGVISIGLQLAAMATPALGFDLELLLEAGRALASGRSPYGVDLVGGAAPTATDLFYSYPPPVAQLMVVFGGVPSAVMLVLWAAAAVGGLLVIAEILRRRLAPDRPSRVVLVQVGAVAPLTLPFTVGLLFGNYDVWFPTLYGLMLAAVLTPSGRTAIAGGTGLVLASLKIHPASMALWFVVRWLRDRRRGPTVVLTAIVVGVLTLVLSVALGGLGLWAEYVAVVRSGTGAVIVDPRNAGIAALGASLLGLGDPAARAIHVGVAVLAVGVTIWASVRRRDPLESFGWATAASLSTLPVTWYHYPSAMIPIALAAWLRAAPPDRRRVVACLIAAEVVAVVALAILPLLWLAIGLVILAARWSRRSASVGAAHGGG